MAIMSPDRFIALFQEYLRINTAHPNPDYDKTSAFLSSLCSNELPSHTFRTDCPAGKPIYIISRIGSSPSLPSILLNSHFDVVPVSEEHWSSPPFAAVRLDNGDIVARGAQDMKSVAIGYICALINLKDVSFKRTIHMAFMPDEETSGRDGMKAWVETEDFARLNVGMALDEGLPNINNFVFVYYNERSPWWIRIDIEGNAGHGSQFISDTAASKMLVILNRVQTFRDAQEKLWRDVYNGQSLGSVTSVNITFANLGVQYNVVPDKAFVGLDVRISPVMGIVEFQKILNGWVEGIEGTSITLVAQSDECPSSSIDPSDKYFSAISSSFKAKNVEYKTDIFPAATDSRWLRKKGIPCYGISFIRNTKMLLHDHNEYLNENELLNGIQFYTDLIPKLANLD